MSACHVCQVCGWRTPVVEDNQHIGKFVTLAHVSLRHPEVFEVAVGKTPQQWLGELQPPELLAYVIADQHGLL